MYRGTGVKSSSDFGNKSRQGSQARKPAEADMSQAVGSRWFRHRGGIPLFMLKPSSARYFSFAERKEIGLLRTSDVCVREIARRIGRSPSKVPRKLTHNASIRTGKPEYRESVEQCRAELVAGRLKLAKLVTNPRLHHYVQDRLEGKVHDAGPRQAPFKGRKKPYRGDRK